LFHDRNSGIRSVDAEDPATKSAILTIIRELKNRAELARKQKERLMKNSRNAVGKNSMDQLVHIVDHELSNTIGLLQKFQEDILLQFLHDAVRLKVNEISNLVKDDEGLQESMQTGNEQGSEKEQVGKTMLVATVSDYDEQSKHRKPDAP
jgi:hypothetical protein